MATTETTGTMKYKDASGNVVAMMPKTQISQVDGLSDALTEAKILSMGISANSEDGVAYTATISGVDALAAGYSFIMVPNKQSTSQSCTLNVNNLGAKNLRTRISGNTATTAVASTTNWLAANKPVRVTYDGMFWVAEMVRPNANDIYGTVKIENGGTGANNAADARTNLGITTGDGTVTSGNAGYAEVGEWADGNSSNENRIGYFVAIDTSSVGTTMVKATSTADVKGVTVATPAFSGGCDANKFDAETGELLPQYDFVAVMGVASVIDNGTCTVNKKCMPADDGTAVPSSNNMGYHVIERVDGTHILIAVEPGADMVVVQEHVADDAVHVTESEKAAWNGKASKPNAVTVTLLASGWGSSNTQTITVSGVLADETAQLITPTPALASQTAYYNAGILCTGQAANSLTFTAITVPTADLMVYVAIQEVAQG